MSVKDSPDHPGATASCLPPSSVESSGYATPSPHPALFFPRSSFVDPRLMHLRACRSHTTGPVTRRKRQMTPADQKDATYRHKRLKNNEAAKRSREKKKLKELLVEGQLLALSEENAQLRAQVLGLHCHSRLIAETSRTIPPLSLWQQEPESSPFESRFCLNPREFNLQIPPNSYTFPLYAPGALSSWADLEAAVPHQASQSNNIQHPLPSPFNHPSALSFPPQSWLVPHLNHSAVRNRHLLLPWTSP